MWSVWLVSGAAILEINKRTMRTDNIRKLIRTNYVTNVYKNRDYLGSVADFFSSSSSSSSSCAKKIHSGIFDSRSGNRKDNIL